MNDSACTIVSYSPQPIRQTLYEIVALSVKLVLNRIDILHTLNV